jgi:hypothetical protein
MDTPRSLREARCLHLSMLFSRRLLQVLKEELAADDAWAGRASTVQAQPAAGAVNRG